MSISLIIYVSVCCYAQNSWKPFTPRSSGVGTTRLTGFSSYLTDAYSDSGPCYILVVSESSMDLALATSVSFSNPCCAASFSTPAFGSSQNFMRSIIPHDLSN